MNYKTRRIHLLAIAAMLLSTGTGISQRRNFGGSPTEPLHFRFMGPIVGNRVASIAGVAGDANTYYAGAASGGIWKSTDGGNQWAPIFDAQPVAAIGSLAVAPSDPNIVWAGTGEAWAIRDSDMMGNGVYKSTDAGKTWTHMGLDESGRIGRMIVHPTNPDIVFACALGRATGPQQERGVFRTIDGGKSWSRVLFADQNTGCSGLVMDAHDPQVLFAGTWEVVMHSYAMFSGGPGSAIYVSRDGGTNWKKVLNPGLPKSPVGKIDVAIAPTDSKRVYALIQTADQGSVWRSDDGGENWKVVNWQRALIGRAGYYIRLAVSPKDANEVFVANSSFHQSTDGGKSFRIVNWGGDTHDIWWDPKNADRFVITHDAGMYMTKDHGRTANRVTLPIGQMYHVAVDNDVPYKIYGNMQDDGTMRGLSTTPEIGGGRGGGPSNWEHNLGGCESGFTLPDPTNSDIVWASCYGNEVTRWDAKTNLARSISPWLHTLDSQPTQPKYRCHWTAPLAIDPFDHNTVYYGCQVILRTSNGGQSWTEISPDLSTKDPRYVVSSGGIVGDNLGQFYGEVVFSIAPSELQKGLIWAGTNDGKVWYTQDAGARWNDVTKNIPGVPPMGVISKIEPSHFDAGTAYVAVDLHLMDNRDPFLYKTTDFGKTWTKISDGLPKHVLGYARVIAENPNRKGMLFAGTGNALFYSPDDGGTWKQLQDGLPAAPVSWIVVQKAYHDLVVSTYGRGFYIMEDITPLEQGLQQISDAAPHFFAPRPTFRQFRGSRAELNYSLKTAAKDPVKIEVLDDKGAVIHEMRGTNRVGINRVTWDLHYDAPRLVALRTTPPENPHIWEEPRFKDAKTRPITHWGIAQAEVGPMAAPGKYSVRVTVDGQAFTQPLELLRDPKAAGTDADLEAGLKLQLHVRNDINAVADMVNNIEWMRKQLEDERPKVAGKTAAIAAIDALDKKMQAVEYRLITEAERTSDDKYFVTAYRLYMNLLWFNGEVGTGAGDVAGNGDHGPTETSLGLMLGLDKELADVQTQYRALMDKDVAAFNRAASGSGLAALNTEAPPPPPPTPNRFGQ